MLFVKREQCIRNGTSYDNIIIKHKKNNKTHKELYKPNLKTAGEEETFNDEIYYYHVNAINIPKNLASAFSIES